MNKWYLIFLLVLLGTPAKSQHNFRKADSIATSLRIEKNYSLEKVALLLTKDLDSEIDKARAIYRWVTYSISYDCRAYHYIESKKGNRKRHKKQVERKNRASKVFSSGKAVCEGYANLMKQMCDVANVPCEIISGYCKNSTKAIGNSKLALHAWNAIYVDNRWYLCDPTWGSGYTNIKVTSFTRWFDDNYFLVEPQYFILNHFPENKAWKLVYTNLDLRGFIKLPIINSGFYKNKINRFYPENGVIRARIGDIVDFIFSSNLENGVKSITIKMTKNLRKIPGEEDVWGSLTYSDLGYGYKYKFKRKGRYRLEIYLNGEPTIEYDCYISE